MTSKSSSSVDSGRMDKMASVKRIAVVAAVVLLLSMAVVGAASAYTVTITTTPDTSISGTHGVTYMYSVDGYDDLEYSGPFAVQESSTVIIYAVCNNDIVRQQDWSVSDNVAYTTIYRDLCKLSFLMPSSNVNVTVTEGKLLPSGYTELEYISSDGKDDYINTGLTNGSTINYGTIFSTKAFTGTQVVIGSEYENGHADRIYYTPYGITCQIGSPHKTYDVTTVNSKHYIAVNGLTYICDDKSYTWSTYRANNPSNKNICLFACYYFNQNTLEYYTSCDMYWAYISNSDGKYLRYYVPCKRTSDNKIGMYDLVTNTFYGNNGSGSFTAGSEIGFKVTYGANGGTGSVPEDTTLYMPGNSVTVLDKTDTFSRDGCKFAGWNTNKNGIGTTYKKSDTFTIYKNTELYAKWGCNVTYDSNGGSGTVPEDTTDYILGATVTVPGNTGNLTKTGYTFAGWNTEADGTGTNYQEGDTFGIYGNTKLYAKWIPASYTFTIPADVTLSPVSGGEVGGTEESKVYIESSGSYYGKQLAVRITTDGKDDDKYQLSLDGNDLSKAYYKVGKGATGQENPEYVIGATGGAGGGVVVQQDISGDDLKESQIIFFRTVSYDGAGLYSGTLQFNFSIETPMPVTGITISGSPSVLAGLTKTLTAAVSPVNATIQNVTWSSSDMSIATVEDTTGIVHGIAAGNVVITATANDGSGVYGTYAVKVNGLPDGYTELGYIARTTLEYIDTGFVLDSNSSLEIQYMTTSQPSNKTNAVVPIGSRIDHCNDEISLMTKVNNDTQCVWVYGSEAITTYTQNLNVVYTWEMNKNVWTVDGHTHTFTPQTFTTPYNCYLFSCNWNGSASAFTYGMRIYYCKIWDGDTLMRYFVPVKRDSDGVLGMYDLCGSICPSTGTPFYTNAGSGTFTAGPVVS